jgi:AcrR family transcriptional regulator
MTSAGDFERTAGLERAAALERAAGWEHVPGLRPDRSPGLRERKKLATRQALGAAAMRLAVERGLENVLVEDIAAAADVSARTFNNYFGNKYEAICALALDRSFRIGEALRERPAAESLWDAVRNAVRAVYSTPGAAAPDPRVTAGIRLVTSSPALRGEYLKVLSIMQYELAGAIAERDGADLATGTFFTRALAGAVTSAVQAATERWLFADPPVALALVIEDALRELAEGMLAVLPAPSASAPSKSEPSVSVPSVSAPSKSAPSKSAPPENGEPPMPASG